MLPGKEGWLWKKGAVWSAWRKRRFVLKGCELEYFRPGQDVPAGTIKLERGWTVFEQGLSNQFSLSPAKEGGRVYHLQAESKPDKDQWVAALAETLAVLNNTRMSAQQVHESDAKAKHIAGALSHFLASALDEPAFGRINEQLGAKGSDFAGLRRFYLTSSADMCRFTLEKELGRMDYCVLPAGEGGERLTTPEEIRQFYARTIERQVREWEAVRLARAEGQGDNSNNDDDGDGADDHHDHDHAKAQWLMWCMSNQTLVTVMVDELILGLVVPTPELMLSVRNADTRFVLDFAAHTVMMTCKFQVRTIGANGASSTVLGSLDGTIEVRLRDQTVEQRVSCPKCHVLPGSEEAKAVALALALHAPS